MTHFNDTTEKEIQELLTHYPTKKAALLPVLHLAQRDFGWVSEEVMSMVAARLELPVAHVYGVVTFYTMYRQKPVGRHQIEVCRTLSCAMMGSQKITDYLKSKLEINIGETTTDDRFTLLETECLASCGTAPCARIDDAYHENLTPGKIDHILSQLK